MIPSLGPIPPRIELGDFVEKKVLADQWRRIGRPITLRADKTYSLVYQNINLWPTDIEDFNRYPFVHVRILNKGAKNDDILYHKIIKEWGSNEASAISALMPGHTFGPFDHDLQIELQIISPQKFEINGNGILIFNELENSPNPLTATLQKFQKKMEQNLNEMDEADSWKKGYDDDEGLSL